MATNRTYVEEYADRWKSSRRDFPFPLKTVTASEQRTCETMFDRYAASVSAFRTGSQRHEMRTHAEVYRFIAETRALLCNGLRFTDRQLNVMFSDDMRELTRQFVYRARRFDPALTAGAVFQASRNLWIMNGLQLVLGVPVELTPSAFAYSLLYPYTDNLLDDPALPSSDKRIFCEKLHAKLDGQSPEPVGPTERKIFRLVSMIEAQYPRSTFPAVYESLLAIHDAQSRSVELLHSSEALSEANILRICLEKGGTSVVADGCLIAGGLTADQESFLFGFGAYLQLMDDVQDASVDRAAGLRTCFSDTDKILETKLNRTYWFGTRVIRDLPRWGTRHLDVFPTLMQRSMDFLLIDAVAHQPSSYSNEYVAAMENRSPFSFPYLRQRRETFGPLHIVMRTAIEEMALFSRSC